MKYTNNHKKYRKIKRSGKNIYTNYQHIYRREKTETSGKYKIQTIRIYTGRSNNEKSSRYWPSDVLYPGYIYWDKHTQGTIH